jgi:NADH-quinone oxidoreductase subunit J
MNNDIINLLLVASMVIAAVYTVMTTRLLHSAVGLGITSVILAIIMYQLNSPLTAVFELSVCAGLISALFISAISMTQRLTPEKFEARKKEIVRRFWLLPVIIILAAIGFSLALNISVSFNLPAQPEENNVNIILWRLRHLDLFGQIVILLAGAFGVVTFFRERK